MRAGTLTSLHFFFCGRRDWMHSQIHVTVNLERRLLAIAIFFCYGGIGWKLHVIRSLLELCVVVVAP